MTVTAPQPPSAVGRDPRESQLSDEKLAQLLDASKAINPASASTSESVTPVLTLDDFEAALAHSASRGRLTVFKFYAPWCRTCTSIKKNYDAMAGGAMPKTMRYKMQAAANFAEIADFHEIEYTAARPLCAQCNITSMPLVHVYSPRGELQFGAKLAKSSFISFCNRLAETVDAVLLPVNATDLEAKGLEAKGLEAKGLEAKGLEAVSEGTRDADGDGDRADVAVAPTDAIAPTDGADAAIAPT